MVDERLRVILEMAAGQYKREAREAATATGKISKEAQTAGTSAQNMGRKWLETGSILKSAGVVAGVVALGHGLRTAIDAAEGAASIMANTEKIIEQTGGAANITADQVADLSSRLSALTGVEDDLVQEGANVLLTFKNIRNEAGEGNDVFDRTAGLMLDVGAVMGTDAKSGALQLGKALNDPVANMGALTRAGLTFSAQQKQQIKELVANNDLLGAQRLILGELEAQVGGTAEASAKASDKIANVFGEMVEAAGTKLLPILEDVGTELQHVVGLTDGLDRVAAHSGGVAESAESLLTAVADLTGGAGLLNGIGNTLSESFQFVFESGDRLDHFAESVGAMAERLSPSELQRAIDGIGLLQEQFGLTDDEAVVLADVLENELVKALQALEASEADKYLRGGLNPAMAELGTETGTTAGQLAYLNDQFKTLIDPAFAALDALDNYREAQSELNTAIADFGEESPQAAEAGQNLISAYGDLVAAAERYAQESGQDIITSLYELGEQAEVPREVLDLLAQQLNEIDGFVANAQVNVNVDQFGSLDSSIPIGGFRHSGGPVMAGVPYVIRPDEEVFVPAGNGQMLLNDQFLSALRSLETGGSSAHHYNIPIQSSGNQQADAQLVGAVASVLRRMESL